MSENELKLTGTAKAYWETLGWSDKEQLIALIWLTKSAQALKDKDIPIGYEKFPDVLRGLALILDELIAERESLYESGNSYTLFVRDLKELSQDIISVDYAGSHIWTVKMKTEFGEVAHIFQLDE